MKSCLQLAILLTAVVSPGAAALAQNKDDESPPSKFTSSIVYYLNEKALHDELKLTDEQRKRLGAIPDEWERHWRSSQELQRTLASDDELVHYVSFSVDHTVEKILTPEQLKRLRQIALQYTLSDEFRGANRARSFLRDNPDVVEQLKITDKQMQTLEDNKGKKLEDVLTDEQKTQWSEMIGPPFTIRGTFSRFSGSSYRPTLINLDNQLLHPDVQKDVGMTAEQKKQLIELTIDKYAALGKLATLSKEEQSQAGATAAKASDEAIGKLLTKAQQDRACQVNRQIFEANLYHNPPAISIHPSDQLLNWMRELKLTAAQKESIQEVDAKRKTEVRKILDDRGVASETEKKIAEVVKGIDAAMLAVLTQKQRDDFGDLFGLAYRGALPSRNSRVYSLGTLNYQAPALSCVGLLDGLYYSELSALAEAELQDELQLTAAQKKTITDRKKDWFKALTKPAEKLSVKERRQAHEELSAYIVKQMTEVVRPGQVLRLRQFGMQQRCGLAGLAAVAGYPEMAADLKLTPRQQDALRGGAPPNLVLNDEQLTMLHRACGVTIVFSESWFAYSTNTPDFSRDFGVPEALRMLDQFVLKKGLSLTRSQETRVRALHGQRIRLLYSLWEANPRGLDDKNRHEVEQELSKLLTEILTVGQLKRLHELELQLQVQQGPPGIADALLRPDVIRDLSINKEQQATLERVRNDNRKVLTLLDWHLPLSSDGDGFRSGRGEEPRRGNPEDAKVRKTLLEHCEAKLFAVLTDEQKKKWKELLGEPLRSDIPAGLPK